MRRIFIVGYSVVGDGTGGRRVLFNPYHWFP